MNVHYFPFRNQGIILLFKHIPQNSLDFDDPSFTPKLFKAFTRICERRREKGNSWGKGLVPTNPLSKVVMTCWCHSQLPGWSADITFQASEVGVLSCFFANKKKVCSFGTEIQSVESLNICIFHQQRCQSSNLIQSVCLEQKKKNLDVWPKIIQWLAISKRPGPSVLQNGFFSS